MILSQGEFGSVSSNNDPNQVTKTIRSFESFINELYWLRQLKDIPGIIQLIDYSFHDQTLTLPRYDLDLREGLTINNIIQKYLPDYKVTVKQSVNSRQHRIGNNLRPSKSPNLCLQNKIIVNPIDIIKQLSLILLSLYDHHIVHGDIRLSNILLNIETQQIVLADFGFSISDGSKCLNRKLGACYYRPPEFMSSSNNNSATWRSDVYCFGIITFEILLGCSFERMPMSKANWNDLHSGNIIEVFRKNFKRYFDQIDGKLKSLLTEMLDPEPYSRPHPEDIVKFFGLNVPIPKKISYLRPSDKSIKLFKSFNVDGYTGKNKYRLVTPACIFYETIINRVYPQEHHAINGRVSHNQPFSSDISQPVTLSIGDNIIVSIDDKREIYMICLYLANCVTGEARSLSFKNFGNVPQRCRYLIEHIFKLSLPLVYQ